MYFSNRIDRLALVHFSTRELKFVMQRKVINKNKELVNKLFMIDHQYSSINNLLITMMLYRLISNE